MRIESSVTSISWIPSEAIAGAMKVPFEMGIAHYDAPPPEVLEDIEALRAADGFRFANVLRGWIDVEDGVVVGHGCSGGGLIGSTTLRVGGRRVVFEAVALPEVRPEPEVTADGVRFVQTAGGRTGVPAPRRVRRAPFVQFSAPLAWTTLGLTLRADGSVGHDLVGASPFPRHWIYDAAGRLAEKTGLIDFSHWYRRAFGRAQPLGRRGLPGLHHRARVGSRAPALADLMRGGAKPKIRRAKAGTAVVEQGEPGAELFLVLDGVVRVEVDGKRVAEYGPGSLHGERAVLEGGLRTSTVRAVTECKLATVAVRPDRPRPPWPS